MVITPFLQHSCQRNPTSATKHEGYGIEYTMCALNCARVPHTESMNTVVGRLKFRCRHRANRITIIRMVNARARALESVRTHSEMHVIVEDDFTHFALRWYRLNSGLPPK
jgi:hypothetical protein